MSKAEKISLGEAFHCNECCDSGEDPKGNPCQECCPHDEHDHGICLDCGLDQSADLAARAEFMMEVRDGY